MIGTPWTAGPHCLSVMDRTDSYCICIVYSEEMVNLSRLFSNINRSFSFFLSFFLFFFLLALTA